MGDLDLDLEFCCTCLKVCADGDKFVSLNFTPVDDISFKNKLKRCIPEVGLENTDDCFLCKSCSAALETSYTFRCMCLRTENKLKEFRLLQNKNVTQKSIKQEMIESICNVEEISSEPEEDKYSIEPSHSEIDISVQPEYPRTANLLVQTEPISQADITAQSENEIPAPQSDSKIEIVKDELGSLLTESLGSTIDINIHIFEKNAKCSTEINSEINIFKSLDAEIEELEKHSYYTLDLPKENKPEDCKQLFLPKDMKKLNTSVAEPQTVQPQKKLSDREILEISCKTIPDLHKCLPAALECQVTLENITISELPVIIPKARNTRKAKSSVQYKKDYKGKVFWCTICHKDVRRRDRFNAHILRHKNIRAYKCNMCAQGFFSSETLCKHKKGCLGLQPNDNFTKATETNSNDTASTVTDLSNSSSTEITVKASTAHNKNSKNNQTKKVTTKTKGKVVKVALKQPKNSKKIERNSIIKTNKVVIKTEKCEDTTATDSVFKIRKSLRKQTPSKKLCNMNDILYRCKDCNYQSYYKQKYQVHLLHHTNDRRFPCTGCSKKFFEKWELNRHIRNFHSAIQNTKSTPNVKKATEYARNESISDDNNWEMDSSFAEILEPKISLIINPETVVTPIIKSIHSLAQTQDNTIEMSFACKICDISFNSRKLLMLHTQSHEFRQTCQVSSPESISKRNFVEHAEPQSIITDEITSKTNDSVELETPPKLLKTKKKRKFYCSVCEMEFASRDHGNIHTGAKPYTCKVCSRQFAAYNTLRKHRFTHDRNKSWSEANTSQKKRKREASPDVKEHTCEVCKKTFPQKEQVYSHSCYNASGDAVYRCQICKNAFIGRAALIEHMGLHVTQSEYTNE